MCAVSKKTSTYNSVLGNERVQSLKSIAFKFTDYFA